MAISRPFAATIGSPHDIVRTLHRESVRTSHIPAYCMSIRRRPCSRKHTADMLMYRSTFVPSRHVACLLACLLACWLTSLACNTLASSLLGAFAGITIETAYQNRQWHQSSSQDAVGIPLRNLASTAEQRGLVTPQPL